MIHEGGSVAVPGALNIVSPIRKEKTQTGKVVYFTHSHTYGVGELPLNLICKTPICVLWYSEKAHELCWVFLHLFLLACRMGIASMGLL